jgi:hypothetical protein
MATVLNRRHLHFTAPVAAQEKLLNGPSTANEVEEAKQLEVSVRDRLLPVYMRLKKQKGDSQGAKTNPKVRRSEERSEERSDS